MTAAIRIETPADAGDRRSPRGGAGTLLISGRVEHLDPNPDVRGERWYGTAGQLGISREMMRDPHVKRSVEAIVDPLLAAFWDFSPGSKEPVDVEAADYARWDFLECSNFERVLRLGTTGVVRDGTVLFESTDTSERRVPTGRFPLHPGNGLGVGYLKHHHRPAWTIEEWHQSKADPEHLVGFEQYLEGADQEEPGFRTIRFDRGALFFRLTWDQEGANFDGAPPLRAAYGAWKCKMLLLALAMIRHEREGVGIPEIEEPDREIGKEDERKAKELLRKLRGHEEAYIYLPSGFKFTWRTSGGQSTGLGEAIEQCNRDIAYNLGVAWMLLGIAGKTGSWALATEQRGHYVLSLEKFARFWESALNLGMDGWSPVERLIRRNYGPDVALPRLVARNMPTRDWTKVLTLLPSLMKSKLLQSDATLRAFIRNVTSLPVEDGEGVELEVDDIADALEQPVDEDEAAAEREENARAIAAMVPQIEAASRQAARAVELAEKLFSERALERREAARA